MAARTRSAEEEVAAVRKQLQTVESELQHADARLARVLSTSSSSSPAPASGDLPPLAGRPPSSPPLSGTSQLPPPRALDSSAGSASSADTNASGSAGDSPAAPAAAAQQRGVGAGDTPLKPQQPQPALGSSLGWIFRCVITTKAGRCIVNCTPHASASGVCGSEGGGLAVGPLCRLLVTMHEFSQGGFLSYVQIHNRGVVLVDGGSYLVGIICATGVDLPAVKLRAVQIRHVFGLLHQSQVDEMQMQHEAEAEAMLKTYTIHSSRTEHGESAEPQTAPPFAHFEQLYLRATLRQPSLSEVWLQPLLQLQGVRRCFLIDVTNGSALLSSSSGAPGSKGEHGVSSGRADADADFGPFLRQCWGTIVEYARILCAPESDAEAAAQNLRPQDSAHRTRGACNSDSNFLGLVFDAGPLGLGGGLTASIVLALQTVSLGRDRPACLVLVYLSAASAVEETRAAARSALAKATSGMASGGGNRGGGKRGIGSFWNGTKSGTTGASGKGNTSSRRTAVRQLPAERERISPNAIHGRSGTDDGTSAGNGHHADAENAGLALSGVAQARLQSEDLDALPPRFRTQTETLRRLYYPSSFALRPDAAAAGLPARVGRSLAAVGQAITSAYPQEHLSMAALPSLYHGNTASAAMIPPRRSGETAGDSFATPKRTQFVAVPPPPRGPSADSSGGCGSDGAVHVMHRPEVAVGRRRGAGPRARRYSDGGSALSGVGVSPRSQPPQSALVPRPPQQRKVNASSLDASVPSGPPPGGCGRSARFIGGRVLRPGLESTGVVSGNSSVAAQSSARTPVRPGAPLSHPLTTPDAGAASDADAGVPTSAEDVAADIGTPDGGQHQEHQRGDGGEESFDTEFALLQLEWPQPIGAIRSEGELAPPPLQLPLPPGGGQNLVRVVADDGGVTS